MKINNNQEMDKISAIYFKVECDCPENNAAIEPIKEELTHEINHDKGVIKLKGTWVSMEIPLAVLKAIHAKIVNNENILDTPEP